MESGTLFEKEVSFDFNHNKLIKNKLNDLSGKDWIKFTKSWFIHRPKKREDKKICHPASYPESLIKEFIEFFTKKEDWILDPFLGTGSTLIACQECGRNGIGIELNQKYVDISKNRLSSNYTTTQIVECGDSNNLIEILNKNKASEIDFCITSPPYWNQLKRNHNRQKIRKENGYDTEYGNLKEDLGNIEDYKEFINSQYLIFEKVYEVMKNKGYLVVITNNIFYNGRLYPLAFDTLNSLSNLWVPKDEKIWCQDDKRLLPLGIYSAWVGNRHHQYCLIFRKEE